MTRRRCLQLLGASLVAAFESRLHAEAAPVPSLRGIAASKGLKFGSAADNNMLEAPREYAVLFAEQCALLAPILSWATVSPTPDRDDYSRGQPNVDFACQHGLQITGAHLLWHERTPRWFEAIQDPEVAQEAVHDHITTMLTHFKGAAWSWNVVNEALNPREGRPDGLRNSSLLDKLGPDFIANAFTFAREADPSLILVYNDYGFEDEKEGAPEKRRALLQLLDSLLQNKVPIDAIGLQSHLNIASKFDEQAYRTFLQDISSRGLKIIITELDVLDKSAPTDIAQRDQAVADTYAKFLSVALDETAVSGVVLWGLSDRYSWQNTRSDSERPDHLPNRPLPFDTNFTPKPAFEVIVKALRNAPARIG
jgi:endo-1,4-beta-xylanase